MKKNIITVRGGGDIATGTIYKLHQSGYPVLVTEIANPSAIRRQVAFSEAVYEKSYTVEGVTCYFAENLTQAYELMEHGKIALMKKNRTEDEKRFGIQIDSLCDVVCFGVFPIVLCYELGMTHFYSIPILIFYGLAGVIRLGYFNVMEEKRQNETSENRKYYQGLPITSMSVALPLLFVFAPLCRGYFLIWLHLLVLAVGVLFITDFRFRKPTNKELAVLVAVVGVAVLRGLLIWKGGRTI